MSGPHMKKAIFLSLFICTALLAGDLPKQLEHDVRFLASDETEGRGLGTKGIQKAATFIETRMRELKLTPAFGKTYRQSFRVKTGVALAGVNELQGVARDFWTPLGFTSSGAFSAPIAFAGYGIA